MFQSNNSLKHPPLIFEDKVYKLISHIYLGISKLMLFSNCWNIWITSLLQSNVLLSRSNGITMPRTHKQLHTGRLRN